MATARQTDRTGGASRGYGGVASNGGGNYAGSEASSLSTLQLLARVLIYLAIAIFVIVSTLAFIETKWMHAEIKAEAKELRKLKEDILTLRKENERTTSTMDQ